jgi:uncharacterized protein (TIGR02246 family)
MNPKGTAMDDINAIMRLKARYFRCMDSKDWASWSQVFADNATLLVDMAPTTWGGAPESGPLVEGRQNIVAYVRAAIEDCVTVHHGHMPEIDVISPTTAIGIWAMDDIVEWPKQRIMKGHGHYHESYQKDPDGEWRIASLHLTRLRVQWDTLE